ncbi:MAG: hypothetical protein ACRC6T_09905 [Sarcina sp.]
MEIKNFQEENIPCLNLVDESELYQVASSELFWIISKNKGFKIFEMNDSEGGSEVWILFIDKEKLYIESFDTQINQLNELEEVEICNDNKLNLKVNEYFLEKLSEF